MSDKNHTMIDAKQAFEWVKTGHWNFKQFNEWLDQIYFYSVPKYNNLSN